MDRPERIKLITTPKTIKELNENIGNLNYNRAIDNYETWLKQSASVEKIEKVILNTQKELEKMSGIRLFPEDRKELAKTISKSILGG